MRILDTNVFVDHLRGHPPAVLFFQRLAEAEDVAFSSLSEAELFAGRANADPRVRNILVRFLQRWTKIDVTNPIALLAGDLVRTRRLGVPDALIAATALHHKADLITKNARHFRGVNGLRIRVPY